jgi:hypothetical protein
LIEALGAMLRIINNSFSYQASKGVKSIEPLRVCFSLIERKLVTLNSSNIINKKYNKTNILTVFVKKSNLFR